jgi:hypothetical protein
MAGRQAIAEEYAGKAARLRSLIHELLWDDEAKFFKVRHPDGTLADVREEIGFIPWYFDLPFVVTPSGVSSNALTGTLQAEQAWQQFLDPQGFAAPMGITTAERRHPQFRSHGVGTCEWDGAVWPFATSQTLVGLANVLRNYVVGGVPAGGGEGVPPLRPAGILPAPHREEDKAGTASPRDTPHGVTGVPNAAFRVGDRATGGVSKADYFEALLTYARSHRYRGKPYIGEYLDEQTGAWLKPDSDRSRYYNHSTFCDLVISGLAGLVPRDDDTVVVEPLVPAEAWDWFCLDNVLYHGRILTILWDRTGEKYRKGSGLRVFADGVEIARSDGLTRVTGKLP